MNLQERRIAAEKAARMSGDMLRQRHSFQVENKAAKDFVTDMDRASEQLIISFLREQFPEDGFYGEEGGIQEKKDGMWVIDPIDGTTNFIKNIPLYTISIAYVFKNEPLVGVVYAPALDEMFAAVKGEGAVLNGQPIHVSSLKEPGDAVAAMSFVHRVADVSAFVLPQIMQLLPQVNDFRRMGSAAFDLCCVACGRVDAFFEPKLNLYDIAAGVVIVREAGGRVSGWRGGEDCLISGNIIATNGYLHAFFDQRLKIA